MQNDQQQELPSVSMADIQQHLDAQRRAATELFERHNRMLSSLMAGTSVPAVSVTANTEAVGCKVLACTASAETSAPAKVISLFDYSTSGTSESAEIADVATAGFVIDESDEGAMSEYGVIVEGLLRNFGADDAMAVNRKQMAGMIFLNQDQDGLFYFKEEFGVLFAVCYVGADDRYAGTLAQMKSYAEAHDLLVNLMAHENRVDDLREGGFTTTPMGIWQRIEPLSEFTLAGSSMRRLRYLVNKYVKMGECRTEDYIPGEDAGIDAAICDVIDAWCELKETVPNFIPEVKSRVMAGDFDRDHRFFVTWRDDRIDNVMVFSRDNMNDGYLMDLEFYAEGLPLGSTEFALSEIVRILSEEGRNLVSLGLTMGTGLHEHDNACPDVAGLFESLKNADYLNGDANAQYKNKYRPVTTTMYLARPAGCGKSKLNDLMLLLGNG